MNGSSEAWFALIDFLFPIIFTINPPNQSEGDSSEIIQGSTKAKVLSMLWIVGAFCYLVLVLQGFYLWGTWEVPQIDTSEAARISLKARGRGGIILLLIRFSPQFLVFGYGLLGLQLRP